MNECAEFIIGAFGADAGHLPHGRVPIMTPPNVVMGMQIGSANSATVTVVSDNNNKRGDSARNNSSSPSVVAIMPASSNSTAGGGGGSGAGSRQSGEDPQTAAQRQAAAKLALRKQLEKTLLQVVQAQSVRILDCLILFFQLHYCRMQILLGQL